MSTLTLEQLTELERAALQGPELVNPFLRRASQLRGRADLAEALGNRALADNLRSIAYIASEIGTTEHAA